MAKRGASKRVHARRRRESDLDDDAERHYVTRWWQCDTAIDCAGSLWSWVDRQRANANSDALMDVVHEAIYRGRPVGAGRAQGAQYLLMRSGQLLNLNIVMSMVDTATSRLTKRRPMAVISADDAGYTEELFATWCSRVLRRKMGGTHVEKESPKLIRDMCIRGDGVWKVERADGDVHPRRIPIYEVVADPFEAEHGGVRQLAHVRPEPRDVLMARFPKFTEQIADAPAYRRNDPWAMFAYQDALTSDYVEVAEAWHLPSGCDVGDGQVVMSLRGGNLIMRRPRACPRLPIVRAQWSAPTRGWRGSGLVEQLAGIQEQINDILRDAREGLKHGSQLTIFLQRGANVNKHHLRARHPKVVEFDGAEPHYVAPNPVSEQAIRILLMLIDQAYQVTGISQMAAQSKNTLGANPSGKAINTMDDIQSDRFAYVEADYQQMRVQLGQCLVDEAQDLALEAMGKVDDVFDEQPEPIAKGDLASWIRNTDWTKVEIDKGDYHLTLEPVNYLSDSREGRFAQVAELGQNGLIPDPSIQADLFNEPDIQRANRITLGPKHNLDRVMEFLADPDVPMYELQPDQYMNLPLGILMAKGELNEAQSKQKPGKPDEALESVLERYREWIELAKIEIKRAESGAGSPSLPGMMANNMGAAPNAETLQPGLIAGAPAPMGPMPGDMTGLPPGQVLQ